MWDNFSTHSVKLNAPNDIPFKSTNSSVEKKACSKQMKFERELSFESDTDFQTFLLPLEQDFTKSSKGYASLLASIAHKEIKTVDFKKESEKSKKDVLSSNFSDTDYFRNSTSSKLLHNHSSYSNDHVYTSNSNKSCYQKFSQLIHDTLENIERGQTVKSNLLKCHSKIIHNNIQHCHNEDHVPGKQENFYSEKCIKICNFSESFCNVDRVNDKSDDDSSESSETDSFYNGCNNLQKCIDDSSSDDSVIFSEEVIQNKNLCSNTEIKQTFVMSINSGNSDDDCQKESKESSSVFLSEDIIFECDSANLENPMVLERDVYDSITFQSEGYINASFEDDGNFFTEKSMSSNRILKRINESWNDSMKNVSGELRESKQVSFVPLPNLVSVFQYEPDDDDYCYSLYVLDQLRFRNRIEEFEHVITPYLTPEHRASIYQRNYLQD